MLSFSSLQNCTCQLHTYSRSGITFLKRNELQRNAACKKLQRKAQFYFASAVNREYKM